MQARAKSFVVPAGIIAIFGRFFKPASPLTTRLWCHLLRQQRLTQSLFAARFASSLLNLALVSLRMR